MQLWDSASQERFQSLTSIYVKKADCTLVVFDVSQAFSEKVELREIKEHVHQELAKWITAFNENNGEKSVMVLVGNKIDRQRTIPYEVGASKAKELGVEYIEVSAATG